MEKNKLKIIKFKYVNCNESSKFLRTIVFLDIYLIVLKRVFL